MELSITGGRALLPGAGLTETDIHVADGRIMPMGGGRRVLDARGLLVLPGLIDLHGDAFERQIQPRPGIDFPMDLALAETETQLLANGITTAFHGITLSWEPGLRGAAAWTRMLEGLEAMRAASQCDMRVHLRWEAFNLDALEMALAAIAAGRVHMLAFNDHTPSILRRMGDPVTGAKYSERAGMTLEAFRAVADAVAAREVEVVPARHRLAAAARAAGLPMGSHDDPDEATREDFRGLGARICEFPMSAGVARAAVSAGDWVVMGSPNVVRGGSHIGWASAAVAAEAGLCRVLTSDYYYPAMLQAPFILAQRGGMDLAAAWALVSSNPAAAAGLTDRGTLAPGRRADVVLVAPDPAPRVVATLCAGRIAYLGAEGARRLTLVG